VADAIAKGRPCRSISGMAGSSIVVVIAPIYDLLHCAARATITWNV